MNAIGQELIILQRMMILKGVIPLSIRKSLTIAHMRAFIIFLVCGSVLAGLTSHPTWAASYSQGAALYLKGERVSPEIRVIRKNQSSFINLPFLTRYFPIVSDWDPEDGIIQFRFGELNFRMYEGRTVYYVNGEKRQLTVAPFERGGQLWLPLQFLLRLGLAIKSQDQRHIYLDWGSNYLLGVENTRYEDRPAYQLTGTKKLEIKSSTLTGPNRLIIDLPGTVAHFALGKIVPDNPLIGKVRFTQMTPNNLRLVFEFTRDCGFKIVQEPGQQRAFVVFNYLVEEIGVQDRDSEPKVFIKTSHPAVYQVENSPGSQPSVGAGLNQLVIDLKGATKDGNAATTTHGDGKFVGAIHTSQLDPQTVRMVMDLLSPAPCFVIRSAADPNRLEVRPYQQITAVNWVDTNSGGRLIIESSSEMVATIQKLPGKAQLQIELPCAKVSSAAKLPNIQDDQVKRIGLFTDLDNTARIVLDLTYYAGFDITASDDRHNLIVSLKKSPIIQKTIVVDAGHGGVDLGACGRQGTREKDINLEVSMQLKDLLEGAGAAVIMSRSEDEYIGLYERPFIANYWFADLFVSVHTNNQFDTSVRGLEVYHYPGRYESRLLAEKVLHELSATTGFRELGVKLNDFVVIRETAMPSILVEMGYLSNFQEESVIQTPEFREKAALGIFQGIIDYYQKNTVEFMKLSKN
jgi:N-acetylmuramoyl-L-alanine amidase